MRAIVIFFTIAASGLGQHKGHIDAGYKMTPMPAPQLMTGVGISTLKITTKSPEAQEYFSQGMSLLHCFWDFEAVYKKNGRQPGREFNGAAGRKISGRSGCTSIFRIVGYRGYSLEGQPNPGQTAAHMILENLIAKHPDNAAANHYLIHVLEANPYPERALQAADVLARLAPASGHMVHMPGHIYYRVGDYERARESFLAAMKVEEDYMQREHVSVIDNWNYPHNISYLIAADVETGRYQEALRLASKLDALPVITSRAIANPRHALTVGATTARLQSRFGHWDDVIGNPVKIGDEELAGAPARSYRDAILFYARGMRAVETRDFATASRESDALDAMQWRLENGHFDLKENGSPDNVLNLLASYSLDLRGNLECAKGHFEEGMKLLEDSADNARAHISYTEPPTYGRPEQESIAYAYLRAKQFGKAREAFAKELKERPKNGHALYGIALSYEQAQNIGAAQKAYAEFLESWAHADRDLPMMQHARLWLR